MRTEERDLLIRARDILRGLKETHYDLYWDIQAALDQPEQESFMFKDRKLIGSLIAHDAMYKKGYAQAELDLKREPVGIVITIGGYPDDSEHTVKLTCRHRDLKDGDLLYTAPSKREPLSYEHLEALVDTHHGYPMTLGRAIEKAHGIGVGE